MKQVLKLSEKQFQQQVVHLAQLYDWKIAHFRPAWSEDGERCMTAVQADGAGFPDLCMAKEKRLIFAELKSETGELPAEQYFWLLALKETGNEVYLWDPSDFDEIQEVLTR